MYINQIALEQNERLQKINEELEIENRLLKSQLKEMREENSKLQFDYKKANQSNKELEENISRISSQVSYLAGKQRSRDFDWDVGY